MKGVSDWESQLKKKKEIPWLLLWDTSLES